MYIAENHRTCMSSKVEQAPGQPFFVDFGCFTGLNACLSYFCWPPCSERCRKTFRTMSKQTSVPVTIHDARQKEQEEGLSKRAFFERHGFVVLKHPTTMSAQDWLSSSATPTSVNVATEEETAVRKIYAKELESVIKELIPKTTEIHFPSRALRRGPGGPNPFYGTGVHQDFGLEPEDLASVSQKFSGLSFDDWNRKLRDGSGRGFSVINFWRPVLPMNGPVKDTPLALCDPNHVEVNQVVTQEVFGFDEKGMISLGLKTSSNHCWYYYPDMTKDEVLVFRQFHHDTTATGAKPLQTVFHSAFKHPKAAGSEPRCSSEYRVGVWWKS